MSKRFIPALVAEREQQRKRYSNDHDRQHTIASWSQLVLRYAGRVGEAGESLANAIESTEVVSYGESPRVRADRETARAVRGVAVLDLHHTLVQLAAVCYAAADSLEGSRPDLFSGMNDHDPPPSADAPVILAGLELAAVARAGEDAR